MISMFHSISFEHFDWNSMMKLLSFGLGSDEWWAKEIIENAEHTLEMPALVMLFLIFVVS